MDEQVENAICRADTLSTANQFRHRDVFSTPPKKKSHKQLKRRRTELKHTISLGDKLSTSTAAPISAKRKMRHFQFGSASARDSELNIRSILEAEQSPETKKKCRAYS